MAVSFTRIEVKRRRVFNGKAGLLLLWLGLKAGLPFKWFFALTFK